MKIIFLLPVILFFISVTGQISFTPPITMSTKIWPTALGIGDVNNDGLNDVVIDNTVDSLPGYHILVYLQSASGTLQPPVPYFCSNVYPGIRTLALNDVNNDGLKDVIIGYDDSIGIFYQNFGNTLNPIVTYYSGNDVDCLRSADLNNDSLQDIVVSHWNDNFLKVFYQTSNGFQTAIYYRPQNGYDEIDVGDVNGDGLLDVVNTSANFYNHVYVFLQKTNGALSNYRVYAYTKPDLPSLNGLAIGDVNNDGLDDVAVTSGGHNPDCKLLLWIQDSITHELIDPPIELATYELPNAVEIADLNCDGKNEIIVSNYGWSEISVYEQQNNGQFGPFKMFHGFTNAREPQSLCVGDINNDLKKDIVSVGYLKTFLLYMNDSKPSSYSINDTFMVSTVVDVIEKYDTVTYETYHYDTLNLYAVTDTQFFNIITTTVLDSLQEKSFVARSTVFCSERYEDTIQLSSKSYTFPRRVSTDTIFAESNTDTTSLVSSIRIYPNPTSEKITIELSLPFDETGFYVEVRNCLGQLMEKHSYHDEANIRFLYLTHFSSGIYFLYLHAQDETVIKKIALTK